MTKEILEKEFEIRKLKNANKQLMNTNTLLNKQYKNLNEHFDRRLNEEVDKKIKVIKQQENSHESKIKKVKNDNTKSSAKGLYKDYEKLEKKYNKLSEKYRKEKLYADIAKDEQRRLEKIVDKKEIKVIKLQNEVEILQNKNAELQKEIERLKAIGNNDGTTAGIPTSMTPLNKKKVIPNFAKNTGGKIGRKLGHKKDKLDKILDEEINNYIKHELKECPKCNK